MKLKYRHGWNRPSNTKLYNTSFPQKIPIVQPWEVTLQCILQGTTMSLILSTLEHSKIVFPLQQSAPTSFLEDIATMAPAVT